MIYDGSGRLTADEIAATYGERIIAGAGQLDQRGGERYHEVWPSFTTRTMHGAYNWQTARYTVTNRVTGREIRPRTAR